MEEIKISKLSIRGRIILSYEKPIPTITPTPFPLFLKKIHLGLY
jgi:hypothetical protein